MNLLVLSTDRGFGIRLQTFCNDLDFIINHVQFMSLDDAEIAVEGLSPDMIIVDDDLPKGAWIKFCSKTRESMNIPFIVISESQSIEKAIIAIKAGAEDYFRNNEKVYSKIHECLKFCHDKKTSRIIPLYGPKKIKSGEIYARVFEFISDACFIIDDETGSIMEANRAATTMYGYTRREFASLAVSSLFSNEELCWQMNFEESAGIYEFEHKKKNMADFPVEMSFSRVQLEGRVFAIITVRDISLRKRAEDLLRRQHEALLKTNHYLEAQAIELESQKRSMELKNRELKKAQKQISEKASDLEAASRYKSEFLANMSHELRTPLNSILVLSKLIAENREKNLTPRQIDFIETVINASKDLARLINDVLDMSKVEAGKMDLCPARIDIRAFIHFFLRQNSPLAEQKKIGLEAMVDCDVPEIIITDQHRLEQILKNFLSNAFKFTEKGGIYIKISVAGHLMDGRCLFAFSVRDTGIGIPSEKQALVFDAFTQADGSISRKYGGTGLGLSISKNIAHLLEGEIRLESISGNGSEFTLIIPEMSESCAVVKPEAENESVIQLPDSPGLAPYVETSEEQAHKKFIMIVSEDSELIFFLKNAGINFGYAVSKVSDIGKMISSIGSLPRVAIIVDAREKKDAWGIIARIKENIMLRHIPVFVMANPDDRIYALKLGARFVIDSENRKHGIKAFFEMIEKYSDDSRLRRLLVIEDDPVQKSLITKIIDSPKIKITLAETAAEAVILLENDEYDCMILDLGLPDMSGMELLNRIRASARMSHIPIIIYTGRELVSDEKIMIDDFAEKIIIKGAKSLPRLLDEVTLFLHCRDTDIKPERRALLYSIHDSRQILEGKRILIVDDDMRHVFILSSILENSGLTSVIARDAAKLEIIVNKKEAFDLILMDISLMISECSKFINHFQNSKEFKNIPVIAMTGERGDLKGRDSCLKAGANDYLIKPVDEDRLLGMLRTWLY